MTPADVDAMPVGMVEVFARWQRNYTRKANRRK